MIDKDLIIQLQQEQLRQKDILIAMQYSQLVNKDTLIEQLRSMIQLLETHVETLQNHQKKDSTNSSKPPSTDIGKPPRTSSLRTKSDKPPGGRQGHSGKPLCFSETPDEVKVHVVKQCACCGKSLAHSPLVEYERRQVFDIPPIAMQVTEHRSEMRSCANCHTLNKAVFPQRVSQAVQYGSNVHHLRDLTFCHQVENSSWAGNCKELLLDIYTKVKKAKEAGATALSKGQWQYWSGKYNGLMQEGLRLHPVAEKQAGKRGVVKKSKTQNMIERFVAYKDEILSFAKNFLIPFGNNTAEQAIRMMKVKQKTSGCFRREQGAKDFATIRSYIATMKKQGISIIAAFAHAINSNLIFSSA